MSHFHVTASLVGQALDENAQNSEYLTSHKGLEMAYYCC